MPNINKLDPSIYNLISAGEVVENPSAVVKELVENSIDAGATEITIIVEEGGIKTIKIIDNGCGMNKDNIYLSYLPHATSKISSSMDLDNISTLGFRGEALASIAAVSHLTIESKELNSNFGYLVKVSSGVIEEEHECGMMQGTTITVSDLFYNTPVRLNFLKSKKQEEALITSKVKQLIFANPNLKFKYIVDDNLVYQTGGGLEDAIYSIYGNQIANNLLPFDFTYNNYRAYGFTGNINITKPNRNYQTIIVNGRVITNQNIQLAVMQAYGPALMKRTYPVYLLNLVIPFDEVDVNVHPSKLDIKFSNFEDLKELVRKGIKDVLDKALLIPKIEKKNEVEKEEKPKVVLQQLKLEREKVIEENTIDYSIFDEPVMKVNEDITDYNENVKDDIENYSKEKKKVIMPEMYPVGLAKGTYIICHNELGLYMIDQHAAKERINYEGYLKAFGNPLKGSIKMLIPLTLEFPSNEFIIIKQNIDVLKDMHFDIEESGINSFTIKEHPTWIKEGYEVESIKKVLEVLISEEKHFSIEKFREKAAIMLSCKMAIKANMNISMEEMEALINDLRKCDNPYTCPHGRPTTIFYSNYELEKMFKRAM